MLDRDRDETFHWHHERDGACSAVLDSDGHPRRCDGPPASSGWWWFSHDRKWSCLDGCQQHARFLVPRPWKVSDKTPWTAPAS